MGSIRFSVDGSKLDDVMRQLERVEDIDRRVQSALRAGGEILLEAQRRRAPVRTGMLKKAIKLGRRKKSARGYSIEVGISGADAPHAHLVEKGHGGPKPAPAHPFMEPALEETEDQIYDAIIRELMSDL